MIYSIKISYLNSPVNHQKKIELPLYTAGRFKSNVQDKDSGSEKNKHSSNVVSEDIEELFQF